MKAKRSHSTRLEVRPGSAASSGTAESFANPFTRLHTTNTGRAALLALATASMLIPSLDASIAASAAVAVISFAATVKWTLGRDMPRSLTVIQAGVALFVIGILARVVEAASNAGTLTFPGYADIVMLPAYITVTVGVAMAVTARHALAKTADIVDAAALSVAAITAALALSAGYFTNDAYSFDARTLALVYVIVELAFLAAIIVLVLGPATTTKCTRWLFAAGLYVTSFDTAINISYAYDQAWIADQLLRTLALPVAAFAVATSFDDYEEFARPGVRTQRHRWTLYPAAFTVITVLLIVNTGPIEIAGLAALVAATTAKLAIGHTIATRLTRFNTAQTDLASALADADSALAALDAGHNAITSVLPDHTDVTLSSAAHPIAVGALTGSNVVPAATTGTNTVITSQDNTLTVVVAGQPRPHEWAAIEQLANLMSFAVSAVTARTERITARTEANWRALSGTDNELVFIINTAGNVTSATPNATEVLGQRPDNKPLAELLDTNLDAVLDGTEPETLIQDEHDRWMSVSAKAGPDNGHVVTVADATARIRAKFTDAVTGLNNANHLAAQPDIANATLITFRVDNFARINDSLGRAGADDFLNTIAERLTSTFRDGHDHIWRGSGPSFVVVCEGAEHSNEWIAARRETLTGPVTVGTDTIHPSFTTVAVPVPEPASIDAAMLRADITVNHRSATADGIHRFTTEIEAAAQRRYRIEEALAAMTDPAAAGFHPNYQPIIDAHTGQIARVEALMRWQHPTLGRVRPDEFIPAAERTGHVAALDQYVMETACADLQVFHTVSPNLHVQVNLSPVGLTPERLYRIADWAKANLAQPPHLTVELIESAIDGNFADFVPALTAMRDAGIHISLDDFGSESAGYSRLNAGPWSQVKLAGMFATDIDPATVAGVISTIKNLGCAVVVENVEEPHQADAMRAAGADLLQGWLFSKDLPADELLSFLAEHAAAHAR